MVLLKILSERKISSCPRKGIALGGSQKPSTPMTCNDHSFSLLTWLASRLLRECSTEWRECQQLLLLFISAVKRSERQGAVPEQCLSLVNREPSKEIPPYTYRQGRRGNAAEKCAGWTRAKHLSLISSPSTNSLYLFKAMVILVRKRHFYGVISK